MHGPAQSGAAAWQRLRATAGAAGRQLKWRRQDRGTVAREPASTGSDVMLPHPQCAAVGARPPPLARAPPHNKWHARTAGRLALMAPRDWRPMCGAVRKFDEIRIALPGARTHGCQPPAAVNNDMRRRRRFLLFFFLAPFSAAALSIFRGGGPGHKGCAGCFFGGQLPHLQALFLWRPAPSHARPYRVAFVCPLGRWHQLTLDFAFDGLKGHPNP